MVSSSFPISSPFLDRRFFCFRHASSPLRQHAFTVDRGSPPECTRMYAMQCFVVGYFHDLIMCYCGCVDCGVSSSLCPSQSSRDVGLSGSEFNFGVVGPVVVPVASELFHLHFRESTAAVAVVAAAGAVLRVFAAVLRATASLRCQRGHCSTLFCHVAGLGALCCCRMLLLRQVRLLKASAPLSCK